MIDGIKNMINSKKEFTEAADLILEESSLVNKLDDTLVLGEDVAEPEIPEEEEEKKEPETSGTDDNPEDNDTTGDNNEDINIEDSPIEDNPEPSEGSGDILDAPIDGSSEETPMPLPGNDLPDPVGKQTGEPIDDADILSTEIDLGSNTMKDVLPVPPGNAPEAVNDDVMNQRIDDGFGGEEPGPSTEETPENPMGAPTEPIPAPTTDGAAEESGEGTEDLTDDPEFESTLFAGLENLDESTKKEIISRLKKNKSKDKDCKNNKECGKECDEEMVEGFITMSDDEDEKPYTEEIVMSGDGGDNKPEETPAEDSTGTSEPVEEPAEEESPVTAAVKDKVAETEAPLEAEAPEGSLKDTLMKKLASMSKNMEDVKLQVSKLAQ